MSAQQLSGFVAPSALPSVCELAPGADGKIGHAQLAFGEGGILMGGLREGFRRPQPGEVSQSISVHVEDVDKHFQRAKEFGARIVLLPASHPFGERQYTAEDLGGYRWTFSQSVADVAPEEWGAIVSGEQA